MSLNVYITQQHSAYFENTHVSMRQEGRNVWLKSIMTHWTPSPHPPSWEQVHSKWQVG